MAKIQGKQVEEIFNASIAAAAAIATTKLADGADFIKRTGTVAFTADQPHGGFKITGLADGVAATDAATYGQVTALAGGLSWKTAVRAATTVNITLSGTQTIDTVSVVATNRVLVKNQTLPEENGIYVAAAGAWARATDMDSASEFDGAACLIQEGSQQSTAWTETATVVTVGVDPVTFVQFDSAVITATNGLQRVGNVLSILPDGDSTAVTGSGLKASVPTTANKNQASAATTVDNDTTGITITTTPGGNGMVDVLVNGLQYTLGQGTKISVDAYFSADGGTTARAIAAIVAGDTLYWNQSVAGFNLAVIDKISLNYNVIV